MWLRESINYPAGQSDGSILKMQVQKTVPATEMNEQTIWIQWTMEQFLPQSHLFWLSYLETTSTSLWVCVRKVNITLKFNFQIVQTNTSKVVGGDLCELNFLVIRLIDGL